MKRTFLWKTARLWKTNNMAIPLVFFSFLLFMSPLSGQAMMTAISTEELTARSELVVTGQVADVTCQWSGDGNSILTVARVTVDNRIRGNDGNGDLTVVYTGGEIGNTGLKVSDMPTLQQKERVLLFLKPLQEAPALAPGTAQVLARDGRKVYGIVGKAQGKYTIDTRGVARKSGFTLYNDEKVIDNDIALMDLIEKIKSIP